MRLLENKELEDTELDDVSAPLTGDSVRLRAIGRIERRRHFKVELVFSALGMAILVLVWALSEYHNAGGWPTSGFSQSSGIHDVWNYWIVYPVGAWLLILAGRAWSVFGRKPISEAEIREEMNREVGRR
jgi:TRAP-type mannitol/chloroaromatic compound transport system permease small subunit